MDICHSGPYLYNVWDLLPELHNGVYPGPWHVLPKMKYWVCITTSFPVAREKQHNNLFFHGHKIPRKNNDYIKSTTIKRRKSLSSSGMVFNQN
jgi:hypothetical protein